MTRDDNEPCPSCNGKGYDGGDGLDATLQQLFGRRCVDCNGTGNKTVPPWYKLMKAQGREFGMLEVIGRFDELEGRIHKLEQQVEYLTRENSGRTDRLIG